MSDYGEDQPWQGYSGQDQFPPPLPAKQLSGKAVASLGLALLSPVFWVATAIPAIVLGAIANREMRRDPQLIGGGLATAGLILGSMGLVAGPFFLLFFLSFLTYAPPEHTVTNTTERLVHIHLRGALSENPQGDAFSPMSEAPPSLKSILRKLEDARDDESVQAIVVTLDGFFAGYAHGEELFRAFRALDASGKPVYIHCEDAFLTTGTYTLLAGASQINAVPTAFLDLTGMYTEGLFLKDGLDKLGIQADIVHMGDYKSAGETVMRSSPSPEAEEGMNWLLDGLYGSSVDRIAEGRGMTADAVRRLIDEGPYSAEEALNVGLVDSRHYQDEFLDGLKKIHGEDIYIDNRYKEPLPPDIDFNSPLAPLEILMADYSVPMMDYVGESVAIVSVEGNIVPGYSDPSAMGASGAAYSGDIRKALEQAGADDTVKAVVLRVNSPGGSVTASEVILRAAKKLKEQKPLVVSMGNLAASGGYYVSTDADTIFASESTITASIGVVGGKIVTAGLWDKLGINWHPYQRGENAGWSSSAAPFSPPQRDKILDHMAESYTIFKNHIIAGRGDKLTKSLDEMAGGRVFTGKQALALGLVDEIGGLSDAIAHAAELAGMDEYDVRTLPDPQYLDEAIVNFLFGSSERPSDLAFSENATSVGSFPALNGSLLGGTASVLPRALGNLDPQRSRAALQLLQCADLLNREGVLAIPSQILVIP